MTIDGLTGGPGQCIKINEPRPHCIYPRRARGSASPPCRRPLDGTVSAPQGHAAFEFTANAIIEVRHQGADEGGTDG